MYLRIYYMKTRTPRRVALLIDTASSFGRGLLRGIGRYARLHGPWLLSGRLRGADGVLALVRTRALARRLLSSPVPVVDLDYALPEMAPWGVANDERAVAEAAARHLLDLGLRHIAFCGRRTPTVWESERGSAFCRALARARVSVHRGPRGDLGSWLSSLPRPAGVFAANDDQGRRVLEAARRCGLRVPAELAVLGVDDDEVLCELADPPLSSLSLDTRRIGFEGAALLDRLMKGRRAPRRPALIPPLGVVARGSTDVLAVGDPAVAAALRHLRANVHRPLQVADLVRAAGVSRKTLELRFRRTLGRTPHEEIDRTRLDRVKELLIHTDWPLKKVAAASGFTYPERLHAVFRRRFRTTPTRFRERHRSK